MLHIKMEIVNTYNSFVHVLIPRHLVIKYGLSTGLRFETL